MQECVAIPCSSAGVTFAFELLLSWNVAFVATHNLRKRIVLKRSKIAHFYVWHSTFIFDFISTMVFVVQVRTMLLHTVACWHLAIADTCTALLLRTLLHQKKLLHIEHALCTTSAVLRHVLGMHNSTCMQYRTSHVYMIWHAM